MGLAKILTYLLPCLLCLESRAQQKNPSHEMAVYIEAAGGKTRIENISSLKITSEVEYFSNGQDSYPEKSLSIKVIGVKGNYMCESSSLKTGKSVVVSNGREMREIRPTGFVYTLSEEEKSQYLKRVIHFGEPWMAMKAEKIDFKGEEKCEQFDYYIYDVTYLELKRRYYIRKDNHLLLKVTMFDGATVSILGDYRNIDGYMIPFKRTGYVNGQKEIIESITKFEINTDVPSSVFSLDK